MTIRQLPSTLSNLQRFAQDEITFSKKSNCLDCDMTTIQRMVLSLRLVLPSNTKPTTNDILRLNFGTGFRGQSFY
jgi:hypothetical protein